MPGMTMVGTKTASSTRVVATTGPVISTIDLAVAALASRPSVSMIRRVFSTTTMASSTTMPITRISPNMVEPVDRQPEGEHHRKGAEQRHRDGDRRHQGGAEVLQEDVDREDHQQDGDDEGGHHLLERLQDVLGGVVEDAVLEILGEISAEPVDLGLDALRDVRGRWRRAPGRRRRRWTARRRAWRTTCSSGLRARPGPRRGPAPADPARRV